MRHPAILYPLIALALWTLLVLLLVPLARVRAVRRGEIGPDDFKYGESAAVPPQVSLPNRNVINLLELPTLFYAVVLLLYVTAGASWAAVVLAWLFVGLRMIHSVIHLTYNHVLHRLTAFSLSAAALLALWVLAALHLLSVPAAP